MTSSNQNAPILPHHESREVNELFRILMDKKQTSTMSFGGLNSCSVTGASSSGVLSELIALGASDVHLTADPTVTYWRLQIEKCTNFAMESVLQTFTGQPAWGSEVSLTLNRTGDLIHWMYVIIDLPAITAQSIPSGSQSFTGCRFPCANPCNPCQDPPAQGDCIPCNLNDPVEMEPADTFDDIDDCTGLQRPYANWVNEIGFAAVSRASFSIGGQIIDTVYSYYMHMWEELSGQPGKRLEEMIGKRYTLANLVEDSSYNRRLYVPLPFYFTRFSGNALPLVSLQFHSVQIHVCFAPLQSLIQVSDCDVNVIRCSDGQPITNQDMNALLDTTYVYLDMEERDRFAVGSFQQLFTQVQQFSTTSTGSNIKAQLNFNLPTLELIWAVQRKCQAAANNTFNFSGFQNRDPVVRVCLRLNNLQRTDREGQYYRLVQPYQAHTNIPRGFIYNYSFALHPEDCQPSGSLNFSRIDNIELGLQLQPELASEEVALYVFARNFNVLRFKQGLAVIGMFWVLNQNTFHQRLSHIQWLVYLLQVSNTSRYGNLRESVVEALNDELGAETAKMWGLLYGLKVQSGLYVWENFIPTNFKQYNKCLIINILQCVVLLVMSLCVKAVIDLNVSFLIQRSMCAVMNGTV